MCSMTFADVLDRDFKEMRQQRAKVKAATAEVRVRTSLPGKTLNQVEKLDNLQ